MKHRDKIEAFFKNNFPFNKEGLDDLLCSFEVKRLKKGELILQSNEIEKSLKFINSGYIREYYSSESKEININFYGELQFSSDIYSFYTSSKTKKYQECISDVELQTLSKEKFDILLEKYNCGHEIVHKSIQNLIKAKDDLEYNRTTKDTEELYNDILLYRSDWLLNIPQYHIASYLNITPETLSRIRKRIS